MDATPPTPSSPDKVVEIPAMPTRKSLLQQSKKRQKRRLKQREEQETAAHAVATQAVLAAQKATLKKYELEQEAQRQFAVQQALRMMNQRAVDFAQLAQQAAQSAGSKVRVRYDLPEARRRRSTGFSQAMDWVWARPASHQALEATRRRWPTHFLRPARMWPSTSTPRSRTLR
jgi:hypothetical protein